MPHPVAAEIERLMAIVRLTRQCRAKQREYFRVRQPSVLNESKDLERRLDHALEELDAGPDLFSEK